MKKTQIQVLLLLGIIACACFVILKLYVPVHYSVVSVPTPNIGEGVNTVEGIVLHHTAAKDRKSAIHTLTTPEFEVSSHVVIDVNGTRYVLASPEQITWHAGRSSLHGRTRCNDFTVGIEFQGNTEVKPLTERQIASAIEYICPLIEKYHIPLENIVTHEMIRNEWIETQNDTVCLTKSDIVPGEYDRFMIALTERLKSESEE